MKVGGDMDGMGGGREEKGMNTIKMHCIHV